MPRIPSRGGGFIVKTLGHFFRRPRLSSGAARHLPDASHATPPPLKPPTPPKPPKPRKVEDFPRLADGPETTETAMRNANPHYEEGWRYQVNCTNCVVAAEHRIRGVDVTARQLDEGRPFGEAATHWNTKADGSPVEVFPVDGNNVDQMDGAFPDGSRGFVEAGWAGGDGGHIWSWEARDGRIHYMDPQTGDLDARGYFDHVEPGLGNMWRVDDADFNGFPPDGWMVPHDG